jgi:hypothetical protein
MDPVLSFALVATDSTGATASAIANVTVPQLKRPLMVTAGANQTVHYGTVVQLTGTAVSSNTGAGISYDWSQTSGPPVTLGNANTAAASFPAPALSADSTLTFQFKATDSAGASASSVVNVTVFRVDWPLSISAGANQMVTEGATVSLTGTAVELESAASVTAYQWVQVGGPPVTLRNPNSARATFVAPAAGGLPLNFQFTAADSNGELTSVTVNVLVTSVGPHGPPILINAGPSQTVNFGTTVALKGSATTSGGEITGYEWTQISGPPVTLSDASTAAADFVAPAVSEDTVLTFQLTGSFQTDQGGYGSGSCTTDVTVFRVNHPLSVSAGPSQMAEPAAVITLAGTCTELNPNARITAYRSTQVGGPSVTLSNAATATAGFLAPPAITGPAPIIDPDLLIDSDFKHRQEPPYTSLYQPRQAQVQSWLNQFRAAPQTLAGLNGMLSSALGGKQLVDLQNLDKQLQAGQDISPQLGAMNLSLPAFNYILQLGTLVAATPPVQLLALEWNDLYSIPAQVKKFAAYPTWRAEELNASISLSPDYFNYPTAPPTVFSTGNRSKRERPFRRCPRYKLDDHRYPHWFHQCPGCSLCNEKRIAGASRLSLDAQHCDEPVDQSAGR